ncbi:NUDIX domain-containing protein [Macrococcus equipercicus]|uniref:NUDIX hydrolase n=1 Tax=Macrococcus equipercicus TaxID=69967 RepID=A0A9Q9BWM0_9STAP|nr:NUDIX hydrolase [Macrococcus equipercicus]KAA1042547.1 NUDIX hydrolase [Macrococcus equipercicus]UTH14408.1 NUDIX hydrolase [Macrococcus equipercicus]
MSKRGNVWLGAAAVVINEQGDWLVVKKQYGGLKDMWSMCAGFVDAGETADQAIVRELAEETGIIGQVEGIIGVRSGVIKDIISDNMIIFLVRPLSEAITITLPNDEIKDVKWETTTHLLADPMCSPMVHEFIRRLAAPLVLGSTTPPGPQFNYTTYHLFL